MILGPDEMNIPEIVILDRTSAGHYLMSTSPDKGRSLTHIVSIGDPGEKQPAGLYRNRARVLRLEFHDTVYENHPTEVCPGGGDVVKLIDFCKPLNGRHKVLFHCFAGVSRSTAAAYIMLCMKLGPGREEEAMERVLRLREFAWPNEVMVQLADQMLGHDGRMLEVQQEMTLR